MTTTELIDSATIAPRSKNEHRRRFAVPVVENTARGKLEVTAFFMPSRPAQDALVRRPDGETKAVQGGGRVRRHGGTLIASVVN